MGIKKRWLVFFIFLAAALIFFNLRFLGWAVSNDTISNVTVRSPNDPPVIWNLTSNLYVCEGDKLFSMFYANDSNGDALTGGISPQNPFFVFWLSQTTPNINQFAIVSGTLDKTDFGTANLGSKLYEESVYIDDGYNSTCCSDTKNVNITIIEINNAPVVEDIGVQTIWTRGENSTFYEVWDVSDIEYNWGYGGLTYNITITNSTGSVVSLFNISSQGVMNFTATSNTKVGVYNVTVCVNDTGLTNVHVNISQECGQTGASISLCDNFSLTVTNANRAPNITAYFPTNLTLSVPGTQQLYFNITKNDSDGTIPDAYWYVNGVLQEKDSGSSVDEFRYTFGCGVSGNATVKAEITDGELNDSVQWNVTYSSVSCYVPPAGGSSSGGGGGGVSVSNFEVEPLFITTTIFEQEGKSFEIKINNTGTTNLNISISIENISDMAVLSEDNFVLGVGKDKKLQLYLYALSQTKPGVYFGKIIVNGNKVEKKISVVIEVKKKEPLFDLKVIVPSQYKRVYSGSDMSVMVDMLNIGLYGTAVDVELYLYITDFDKVIVYELSKEMIAVKTNLSVERKMHVPIGTRKGVYIVLGEVKYNNLTVTTYDTFSVVERKYLKTSYIILIIAIIALIIFILFLIYKRRKDRRERGYR